MRLDRAVELVPPDRAAEVLPHLTTACFTVVRQLMGQKSRAEAYAHVERARLAIEAVRVRDHEVGGSP